MGGANLVIVYLTLSNAILALKKIISTKPMNGYISF